MIINTFTLNNFRCFESVDLQLHHRLNVLVGVNGVGKTTMLEALRIFLGSIFVEMNKIDNKIYSPSILIDDVRMLHLEPQPPVKIWGEVGMSEHIWDSTKPSIWGRTLNTLKGKTIYDNRPCIQNISSTIQRLIREGSELPVPLVAYYSTNRYKKEKRNTGLVADGSRLRGYYNALDTTTNVWFFLDVYKTATLAQLQGRHETPILEAVHDTVVSVIPLCTNIWYDAKKDGLYLDMTNGETIPFNALSDGVRCMVAMTFELAIRCYLLNPFLGKDATKQTPGVVLIDEIDLHLHPSWQHHVLNDLVAAFPMIQFIVTTHAPIVLQSVYDCKVFSLTDSKAYIFPPQYKREVSAILHDMGAIQGIENCEQKLSEYRLLIEQGKGRTNEALKLRETLNNLMGMTHSELQRADVMLELYA